MSLFASKGGGNWSVFKNFSLNAASARVWAVLPVWCGVDLLATCVTGQPAK